MEEGDVKVKKKNKTGPLKSTPGFLKCMRNVYLYFKEEKEKGALNIPINSFIERTAVACGVGRKTLYNYAKKGLFDEHPAILQPKQKKKRAKHKLKSHVSEDGQLSKRGRKKGPGGSMPNAGPSTSPVPFKNKSPSPRVGRTSVIQSDVKPVLANENLCMQSGGDDSDSGVFASVENRFNHFMINRDQGKGQQVQVVQQNKIRESAIVPSSWLSGTQGNIKRDVDYFTKNNIGHNVYSMHTTESQSCTNDLNGAKVTTCQQQSSDHLTDL